LQGNSEAAEGLLREQLAGLQKVLGPEAPGVLRTALSLHRLLDKDGRGGTEFVAQLRLLADMDPARLDGEGRDDRLEAIERLHAMEGDQRAPATEVIVPAD
jgi:hypothetical protein